jgi:hypothetical protein
LTGTSRRDGLSSSAQVFSRFGSRAFSRCSTWCQGEAGVDDVLDHQHVAPGNLAAQVLQDAHLAAGVHRIAVAGGFQEIHLDRQLDLAHQIGDEHEGPAQQAHHHQLVGALEMRGDLARQASTRAAMALALIIWSIT